MFLSSKPKMTCRKNLLEIKLLLSLNLIQHYPQNTDQAKLQIWWTSVDLILVYVGSAFPLDGIKILVRTLCWKRAKFCVCVK